MLSRIIEPGLSPELTGDLNGVDAGRLPPGLLVTSAMGGAVMRAAEWDGEFVLALRLQVAKSMPSMASRRLYGLFLGVPCGRM
jgi:hypothetical protein